MHFTAHQFAGGLSQSCPQPLDHRVLKSLNINLHHTGQGHAFRPHKFVSGDDLHGFACAARLAVLKQTAVANHAAGVQSGLAAAIAEGFAVALEVR